MLQNKDIKNLGELIGAFSTHHDKSKLFSDLIQILKLGSLHGVLCHVKLKGISAIQILQVLICLPFVDQKNVHSFTTSAWMSYIDFGKDVFYRLKNNSKINWRSLLLGVVRLYLSKINSRSEKVKGGSIKALIFDDTTIRKTGYKIEGTSMVYDHVNKKLMLGFQLLVMGYYDGTMFIPIDFSIHRERGKNKKKPFNLKPKHLKKQHKHKRDIKSAGYRRKKELDHNKITAVISMISRAIGQKMDIDYVLTDSWFTCWDTVSTAIEKGLIYIGMFSKVKTIFLYKGKQLTYQGIRKKERKNIKRNRKFKLYYIRTVVRWHGQDIVLYHTRRGKRGKWKILLSTDIKSNFTQTVQVYQLRWSIEVYFKESKQMLGLGKSQSNNFDGQIADTTINMIQYIFLSLIKRVEGYETKGKLFENTKAEVIETKLHDRLIQLLMIIFEYIELLFEQADSDKLMKKLLGDDGLFDRIKFILQPPENRKMVA